MYIISFNLRVPSVTLSGGFSRKDFMLIRVTVGTLMPSIQEI